MITPQVLRDPLAAYTEEQPHEEQLQWGTTASALSLGYTNGTAGLDSFY